MTIMNNFEVHYVISRYIYNTDDVVDRAIVYIEKNSRQVHFGCRYIGLTFNKEFYKDFIRSDEYFITKAVDILQGSSLTYDYTITRVFGYIDENGNTRIFGLLPKYENNKRKYIF